MTTTAMAGLVPEWTVGDRLRKAREITDLEANQFADELGISRNTVHNYERGRTHRHSRLTLRQWATYTGVSLHWIMTGDGDPRQPDQEPISSRWSRHLRPVDTISPSSTDFRAAA